MFQRDVAPLDVAKVPEPFNKCREQWPFFLRVTGMPQNSNFWDAGLLLRACHERPRRRCATEKRNKLAPPHGVLPLKTRQNAGPAASGNQAKIVL